MPDGLTGEGEGCGNTAALLGLHAGPR